MPTAHEPGFCPSAFLGHCVSAITPNFHGLPFERSNLLAAIAALGVSHGTSGASAMAVAPSAPDLMKFLRSISVLLLAVPCRLG